MARHLFIAPSTHSFGEVVLGLRLAQDLRRRGDEIVFLAPAANEVLFRDTGIRYEVIDPLLPRLEQMLSACVATYACDSVVLVDLMVTVLALTSRRIDLAILDALPVPVYAIDIWDLRRADLRIDLNAGEIVLPDSVRRIVPRRLVPVPFGRLDAVGAYDALPEPVTSPARASDEKLVLLSTSRFQTNAVTAAQKRVLATVPRHVVELCLRADPRVHVIHVGPEPIDCADARYRFQPQLAGPDYTQLLAGCDLMVTLNQSATSITTALACEVPTLVAISHVPRDTSRTVPFPFRVFPFGFVTFLSSLLEGNPYAEAIAEADVAPGDAFVDAVRTIIFDENAREAMLVRMRAYTAQIRELPSIVERFDSLR